MKIDVYGQTGCTFCVKAVRYLEDLGVGANYRDINFEDARLEMFRRNPSALTVPQIFIGERFIGGYDQLVALPITQLQQMIGE